MILHNLEELKNAPEFPRFRRFALAALAVWLAFFAAFGFALSAKSANESRLREAELVLRGASELRSYPERSVVSAEEPLTAVSAVRETVPRPKRLDAVSASSR